MDEEYRVLLVEDNKLDARCVQGMLAMSNGRFTLEHEDTLAGGIDRLKAEPFHVVLLDLTLSDSSGLTTFTTLLENADRTPVIVLTGNDDARVAVEAVRGGAQDYLIKAELTSHLLTRAITYAIERG